ncbi:MAG TPA: S46 family peptidase [Thermoanaerobaculia bacterium]|nr:S46 family peptidase [Thermoanaerobaculia bacterium]
MKSIVTVALLLVTSVFSAFAIEGKWTPQQVLELDARWLKKEGLELSPKQLWDPAKGTGLLAGTVNIGGCSGGFISNTGLIITNHHCIFSILQQHSTPQNDLITNGFLARSHADELAGQSIKVTVPRRFTDVTQAVLSAVGRDATDLERKRSIDRKQNELVIACEKLPGARCKVAAFEGGLSYVLVEAQEFPDVRLVYAPPRSVGEYGGEVDNWMWPRHTGDFSIARVYVDGAGKSSSFNTANVPYKPSFFFPIASKGVRPGDFVMVLGYPGTTYRALTSDEMTERRDLFFARREELYGEWIKILEEATKGVPAGEIAVASDLKSLLNRYKNAQGQLAGFKRGSIVEKQQDAQAAVLQWASSRDAYRGAVTARTNLGNIVTEGRKTWERDFLLEAIPLGSKALYFGTVLARSAFQRTRPDLDRESDYTERNLPRLREKLEREEKNVFQAGDRKLFESFVRRARALSPGQRIAAIDGHFPSGSSDADVAQKIDELYAGTRVFNLKERLAMFSESEAQLRARQDPILDLSLSLDQELRDLKERRDRTEGAIGRLRPEWRRAVIAQAGKPVAPDANSTLRVSFGHVVGYEPRDGVMFTPQTTLGGAVKKHTGTEPFNLPRRVLDAAAAKRYGRWRDSKLGDVPVAFLADADTTGGSSGSPAINGKGELVGVNFDRVWENVAGDFGYNTEVSRNVNADVRYLLWILDQVEDAGALLKELGIRLDK